MRLVRIRPIVDIFGVSLVAGAVLALALSEARRPLRRRTQPRLERYPVNARYGIAAAAIVRGALVPTLAACASSALAGRIGLTRKLPLPPAVRAVVAFLALDYTMYRWHRLNHGVPLLWRFHQMHHADRDLDVSTALRFHPAELCASIPIRALQTVLIGPSLRTALLYEVLMQTAAAWHHANLALPEPIDRALSQVVVTPRMHGIHHSIVPDEQNSNWSVIFSFWDRLHGTMRLDIPQSALTIGLPVALRERG